MTAPIFISFSSKDHKLAQTVCDALEARGFACWISNRDVLPGQNYQEEISRAIRAAKVMLLVFTANANASDEIKKEVALAGRAKAVVIPLRMENVAPNDAFDYEFATRQWIDAFDGWEAAFKTLAAQIATIVPPQALASGAAPIAPAPAPSANNRNVLIAAGIALLVIASGFAWSYFSNTKPAAIATPAPPDSAPPVTPTPPGGDPFPHRRPGLWEQRTSVAGALASAVVTRICIDKATEAALISAGSGTARKNCSMTQSNTVGTATISDATCTIGALTVSSHTVGTFIGDTAFELNTTSHMTGPNAPPVTVTVVNGKWTGACPPTMKPGDMQMPDGRIIRLIEP